MSLETKTKTDTFAWLIIFRDVFKQLFATFGNFFFSIFANVWQIWLIFLFSSFGYFFSDTDTEPTKKIGKSLETEMSHSAKDLWYKANLFCNTQADAVWAEFDEDQDGKLNFQVKLSRFHP